MSPLPASHNQSAYPGTAPFRVCGTDPLAKQKISTMLTGLILERERSSRKIMRLILCIGSDRSTGDALGPLVGAHLSKMRLPRTWVWGTLSQPVHALNLADCIKRIENEASPLLVIAVDASLGKPGSIGFIEVADGPLHPGAGVNKQLPPVGHCHVSGIVNLGGFMEQMVLQSTRLFHVMEMAEVIAGGLQRTLTEI